MMELVLPSLLVGLMLAAITGPLGSFVGWGRMAYFGDTLAHSALLGVGLALLLEVHLLAGVVAVALMIALAMSVSFQQRSLGSDTLLGILSHGTLALGLVLISQIEGARVDMMAMLFGDLLATTPQDVIVIGLTCLAIGGLLGVFWRPLLNLVISPDLAQAEGAPVRSLRMLLMVLLALTVAIGMRVVGALLLTAMLIIPAAAARPLSPTPERMALLASLTGALSVAGGLGLSVMADTPAGPGIVLFACGLFLISRSLPHRG
jgi:zinc transport system permease protein